MLDDAGFHDTKIYVSADLDLGEIKLLKEQGASVDCWDVGNALSASHNPLPLQVSYTLGALKNKQGKWDYKIKIAGASSKQTDPGKLQVRRYYQDGFYEQDVVFDPEVGEPEMMTGLTYEDLLKPIFRKGQFIYPEPSLTLIRETAMDNVLRFSQEKHSLYNVQIEKELEHLRGLLINKLKNRES